MDAQIKKFVEEKIGGIMGLRQYFLPALLELDLTDQQIYLFFRRASAERIRLWIKISEWLSAEKLKASKDNVKWYIKKILKI